MPIVRRAAAIRLVRLRGDLHIEGEIYFGIFIHNILLFRIVYV